MSTDLVKDGYVVTEPIIGPEDLMRIELELKNLTGIEASDFPKSAAITDGLNRSYTLAQLVMHPRLLQKLVAELGDDFKLLQHCDILVNHNTNLGRHSVDRNERCSGDCWTGDDPYTIVRVLLFTDDDQVGVIPDTHLIPGKDSKKAINVDVPAGSLFIHDARLYTGLPDMKHPRYVVTPFFSLPNAHAKKHHTYITHQRKDLGYLTPRPKLYRLLASLGVLHVD
jgi:hypothetical protein